MSVVSNFKHEHQFSIYSSALQLFTVIVLVGFSINLQAASPDESMMYPEELLFLEVPVVVTASRKEQKLTETSVAAYVISQEDIRRSGLTTIPELMRLVPGMSVGQIDANNWAISSRGFNGRYANMLLVLIDGRTVYTPFFSGVYWDVQDTLLADIERIEVIRGPGSTLWGANAVNGIVNIITKNAKNSQGGLLNAGAGDQEKGFGAIRYGSKLGDDCFFRIYAKYFDRNNFVDVAGADNQDEWEVARGGFRMDWKTSDRDTIVLLGEIYDGDVGTSDENELKGGSLQSRWRRTLSKDSEAILQIYFDRTQRDEVTIGQTIDTYDLDFQHRFPLGDLQEISWGLGYRRVADEIKDRSVSIDPGSRDTDLFSAFVQDRIALNEDLSLTVGSKFEENDYTGFEYQPSARLLWHLQERHALWAAVSRAIQTPSRTFTDTRFSATLSPGPPPTLFSLGGGHDLESQELIAYEIGYRRQLRPDLSLDVTGFYNDYDNLFTSESTLSFETDPSPHYLIFSTMENLMNGESYGIEIYAKWRIDQRWKLSASYSYLHVILHLDPASTDAVNRDRGEGNSPRHQFHLRSYLDLPCNIEFDTALYYVDHLSALNIHSHTRMDIRLGWRPRSNLELSLAFQNLLDDQHPEFSSVNMNMAEVVRSIYGKVTWRF